MKQVRTCVCLCGAGGGGGGGGEWRAIVKKRQPGTLCAIGARPHLFKIVGLEGGGGGGGGQPKMFSFILVILLKNFSLKTFSGIEYPHQHQEWKGDVPP